MYVLDLTETKLTKLQTILEEKIHTSKINESVHGIKVDRELVEILDDIVDMRGER
jgi:hypothetical protein